MNGKAEKKFKKMMFIVEMLFIPTIHLIVFFFYLNIDAISMAFKVEEHGQIRWTLENFTRFFGEFQKANSQIPESLKNTMIFFLPNRSANGPPKKVPNTPAIINANTKYWAFFIDKP